MKKIIQSIGTCVLLLFLSACPYESPVPIDQPNQEINPDLLGKWIKMLKDPMNKLVVHADTNKRSEDSDEIIGYREYMTISKKSEMVYLVEEFTWNDGLVKYDKKIRSMHISMVNGVSFMNFQVPDKNSYFLYRVERSGDTLNVMEVTDNIDDKFNRSEELKAFVEENMHLSFFYNKDETAYFRASAIEEEK